MPSGFSPKKMLPSVSTSRRLMPMGRPRWRCRAGQDPVMRKPAPQACRPLRPATPHSGPAFWQFGILVSLSASCPANAAPTPSAKSRCSTSAPPSPSLPTSGPPRSNCSRLSAPARLSRSNPTRLCSRSPRTSPNACGNADSGTPTTPAAISKPCTSTALPTAARARPAASGWPSTSSARSASRRPASPRRLPARRQDRHRPTPRAHAASRPRTRGARLAL